MDALYTEAEDEYKEDEERLTAPPGIDNSPEERKRLEDE